MLIYTVSPAGSDQNPGTSEAPLQTLQEARNRVRQSIHRRHYRPDRPRHSPSPGNTCAGD